MKVNPIDVNNRPVSPRTGEAEASEVGNTVELGVLVGVFLAILVSSIEPIGLRHRCRFLREKCNQGPCFKDNKRTPDHGDH